MSKPKSARRRSPNAPVRLIPYVRVSLQSQAEKGVSLAAQHKRLRAYAEAHGYELANVAKDAGVSGKVAPHKRPALSAALEAVRAGEAEGILALKLDRLSRSTKDTIALVEEAERHDWRLVSVSENLDTGTAAGRMVVTILAALAQMEREQIGERTSLAMDHVAREGRARSSRLPFGYRVKGSSGTTLKAGDRSQLVKHRGEQAVLRKMLAMQEEGLGARRIARALNEAGGTNPRTGKPWNFGTVASILRTVKRRESALAD